MVTATVFDPYDTAFRLERFVGALKDGLEFALGNSVNAPPVLRHGGRPHFSHSNLRKNTV